MIQELRRVADPLAPRAWGIALLFVLLGSTSPARSAIDSVEISPDVSVALDGTAVDDEEVAKDDGGAITLLGLALPGSANLIAHHTLANGDRLSSFDIAVSLPGSVTADPGDVVRYDGEFYTIEFDASEEGLTPGAVVDAVSTNQTGDLVISFDIAAEIGGVTAEDEDLVLRSGASSYSLYFDGSNEAVPTAVDLDAVEANLADDDLIVSFDTSGEVGGVAFDDEDLLRWSRGSGSWSLEYDGSERHAGWNAGDLDAAAIPVPEACAVALQATAVSVISLLAGGARPRRRMG